MEMLHTKATERRKLLVEFALFVVLCLSSIVVYQRMYQVFDAWLNMGNFMIMSTTLLNVLIIVSAFVLFNTSFFSFQSYRAVKMMIMSAIAGSFSMSYLYFFSLRYATNVPGAIDVAVINHGTISTYLVLTLVGGIVWATLTHEESIIAASKGVKRLLPIIIGFALTVFNIFVIHILINVDDLNDLNQANCLIAFLCIVMVIGLLVLKLKMFIDSLDRYQLRIATSSLFLIMALLYKLFPDLIGIIEMNFFNFFLAASLVSYTYSIFRYNISVPLKQQANAEKQIKLYAENLEKIVHKRTADMRRANLDFIRDIEYAKNIQQSLLPGGSKEFSKADFVAAYFPCERLSGDFYDIFKVDEEMIGMYVLDVSGHGIPAALMTMFCMNYIKSSDRLISLYRARKPSRNLKHFFEVFNEMNFPDEMHMVIFIATYDQGSGTLTYCSGGMNTLPIVIKKNGETLKLDESKGFPICKVGNFFVPDYVHAKIQLDVGDRVFFYTDGLTDKGEHQVFDEQSLIHTLVEYRDRPIKELKQKLVKAVSSTSHKLDDDLTFFMMEVTHEKVVNNERSHDPE